MSVAEGSLVVVAAPQPMLIGAYWPPGQSSGIGAATEYDGHAGESHRQGCVPLPPDLMVRGLSAGDGRDGCGTLPRLLLPKIYGRRAVPIQPGRVLVGD